ncbi:hypothetical protein Ahy_A08g040001 isoform B [Arachis hypogaea]|uniref:Uncharacterized protein n=1 Tax=Arachis hypogaea TaxID=3818 RepID=A0A445BYH5_ARAHY|nr:hypothetical protein Ahy_A08g040001 isoform B [Arachis hypogaea]
MIFSYFFSNLILIIHHSLNSYAHILFGKQPILLTFFNFNPNLQPTPQIPRSNCMITIRPRQQHELTRTHERFGYGSCSTMCYEAPNRRVLQNQLLLNPSIIHNSVSFNSFFKPFRRRFYGLFLQACWRGEDMGLGVPLRTMETLLCAEEKKHPWRSFVILVKLCFLVMKYEL